MVIMDTPLLRLGTAPQTQAKTLAGDELPAKAVLMNFVTDFATNLSLHRHLFLFTRLRLTITHEPDASLIMREATPAG